MAVTNNEDHFYESVYLLAKDAGFGDVIDIHVIKGGANNRVYRVENADKKGLLKKYFRHTSDPRNRLDAEFNFISFAWDRGVRGIPEPFACNRDAGIALYEWIEGRLLTSEEISEGYIRQALGFFKNLNQHKEDAHNLGVASEACFSLREHINLVEKRIDRLLRIEAELDIDLQALKFVETELFKLWKTLCISMEEKIKREGWGTDDILPLSDRRLSPSDFGFHNALLTKSGQLKFIDFEYAGWDDPAKMVCDFFCQPQVPVSRDYYDLFLDGVISYKNKLLAHRKRIDMLFPLYQIKWCCIMLNDFSKTDSERRQFANNNTDREQKKIRQLDKAQRAFKHIRLL
jgi:thiamine kinase-like enzyme